MSAKHWCLMKASQSDSLVALGLVSLTVLTLVCHCGKTGGLWPRYVAALGLVRAAPHLPDGARRRRQVGAVVGAEAVPRGPLQVTVL